MNTEQFHHSAAGQCRISGQTPDQVSINLILKSAKKKPLKSNAVIIARFDWLKRNALQIPQDFDLANLCLVIKEGKLKRVFYSDTLTHVIKKQRYHIQILN